MAGALGNRFTSKDYQSGSVNYSKRQYFDRGFNGAVRECRIFANFTTANNLVTIPHALGYVPTNWRLASNPSNARIWTTTPGVVVLATSVGPNLPFSDTYVMFYCDTAHAVAEIILS